MRRPLLFWSWEAALSLLAPPPHPLPRPEFTPFFLAFLIFSLVTSFACAAESLHLCPMCALTDCNPPASSVLGMLQVRIQVVFVVHPLEGQLPKGRDFCLLSLLVGPQPPNWCPAHNGCSADT